MALGVFINIALDRFRKNILLVSPFRFVITFTVLSFLVTFVTYFFNYLLVTVLKITLNSTSNPLDEASYLKKAIAACIIAPLLETIIFQWLIIEIMQKKMGTKLAVFISALLFGLSHFYSLLYIINTFFIGLIFSSGYALAKEKRFNPILITICIHSLHNFTILLIEVLLNFSV